MKRLSFLAVLLAPVTVLAMACAAPADQEDSGDSANDLSGSIGDTRSCAAVNAYEAADIADFDTPADSELPAAVKSAATHASALAVFDVKGIGKVYALDLGSATSLLDRNGRVLAQGVDYGDHLQWSNGSKALGCGGATSGGSDGGADGGSEGGSYPRVDQTPASDGGDAGADSTWVPTPDDSSDASPE